MNVAATPVIFLIVRSPPAADIFPRSTSGAPLNPPAVPDALPVTSPVKLPTNPPAVANPHRLIVEHLWLLYLPNILL